MRRNIRNLKSSLVNRRLLTILNKPLRSEKRAINQENSFVTSVHELFFLPVKPHGKVTRSEVNRVCDVM
ncbi:hypothetical protein E2C01_059822 [Portunus trituberculatus]|uniref:Uncharacterized protein n=1 Tax=Portunus trituberculatus TaxID=210409 RepID=A0A5B7H6W5_PORTR|nr:hypothetical protein [Portunus trituberculatus]